MAGKRSGSSRAGAKSPVFAAVDLGTNNCRLLIARFDAAGAVEVVDSFSRIVRLGEGVARSGMLSEAAIARTIEALKVIAARIRAAKPRRMRAIVTEAARRAKNAAALIERVERETGLLLEMITPDEEARLAAIGCTPLIDRSFEGALVFDIGGGSTEIVWMRGADDHAETIASVSLPLGVVTMADTFGYGKDQAEAAAMRKHALAFIDPAYRAMESKRRFERRTHHLLGTSGTVTTLAAIALDLPRYDRAKVDGSWHDATRIAAIGNGLVALDLAARAKIACVGAERADLIVPGAAIYDAIHSVWCCEKLRVADRGLREGILRELAAGC